MQIKKGSLFKLLFAPKATMLSLIFKSEFINLSKKELFKKIINLDEKTINIIKNKIKEKPLVYSELFVLIDALEIYLLLYVFIKIISKISNSEKFKDKIYSIRKRILDKIDELDKDGKYLSNTIYDKRLGKKIDTTNSGEDIISYPGLKISDNLDIQVLTLLFKLLDNSPKTNIPMIMYVFITSVIKTTVFTTGLEISDLFGIRKYYNTLFIANTVGYLYALKYNKQRYINKLKNIYKECSGYPDVNRIINATKSRVDVFTKSISKSLIKAKVEAIVFNSITGRSYTDTRIDSSYPMIDFDINFENGIEINKLKNIKHSSKNPIIIYFYNLFNKYLQEKLKNYNGDVISKDEFLKLSESFFDRKDINKKLLEIKNYVNFKIKDLNNLPPDVKKHIDQEYEKFIELGKLYNNTFPKSYNLDKLKNLMLNPPKEPTTKEMETIENYIKKYYGSFFGLNIKDLKDNDFESVYNVILCEENDKNKIYNKLSKYRPLISGLSYLIISFINKTNISPFLKYLSSVGVKLIDELINAVSIVGQKYDMLNGINSHSLRSNK